MTKLSLKMQMAVGFGTLLLIVMLLSGVGYRSAATSESFGQSVEFNSLKKNMARDIQLSIEHKKVGGRDALLSGKTESLHAARAEFVEKMDALKAKLSSAEGKKLFADLLEGSEKYDGFVDRAIELNQSGKTKEGLAAFYGPDAQHARGDLQKSATSLADLYNKLANEGVEEQKISDASSKVWLLVLAGVGIVAGIVVAIYITSRITAAINGAVSVVERISTGDVSANVPEALRNRKDEIGVLANAMQTMTESLRRLIGGISGGVQTLATSATQLSVVSKQTSAGAASMSEKAHAVAAASEEASASTLTIASGMEESSSSLTSVASATEEMSATVGDIAANTARARTISEQASSQAQAITDQMQKLGQAAQEIGHVTETITNISAQTNLLALNATIEAARAGTAGKGFAVVANEIKELARQTAEATEDIKARISGIQSSTGSAISDITQITAVIKDVGAIVANIAAAIEEQATVTKDVAGNIAQASAGVNNANEHVNQTAEVSKSIARDIASVTVAVGDIQKGGEQVEVSAGQLAQLAEQLSAQVAQFRM